MKIRDARFLASASSFAQLPPPAFAEIAFAGRSNVGKSSLINSLVDRRKLVRTSNTPGCTRGINLFRVELFEPEAVLDLVDLPGYGFARRSKAERKAWQTLIEGFLRNRPGLRGVVVITDVRRGFEEDDRQLVEFLEHIGLRAILVATKLDKLAHNKQKPRLKELERKEGIRVHGYSSEQSLGRDKLWRTMLRACSIGEVFDGVVKKPKTDTSEVSASDAGAPGLEAEAAADKGAVERKADAEHKADA